MTNFVITHLHFEAVADDPIVLRRHWAGNYLRGALGQILLRTTCPEYSYRTSSPPPEHTATCPACWLLTHRLDPGHARRAYSLVPPLPPVERLEPGQRFSFTLTLYGDGWQFLPYFVLAVSQMGYEGVGVGRGRFTLRSITARNPLRQREEVILAPGDDLVKAPELAVSWADALGPLPALPNNVLTLHFLSPTRLIDEQHLAKEADFAPFFRRLLRRLDDLRVQLAGELARDRAQVAALHQAADAVLKVDAATRWIELIPRSGRDGREKPLSGFVGWVAYQAADWEPLWPYIRFGQALQVGKNVTKGNGVYQIAPLAGTLPYWQVGAFSRAG